MKMQKWHPTFMHPLTTMGSPGCIHSWRLVPSRGEPLGPERPPAGRPADGSPRLLGSSSHPQHRPGCTQGTHTWWWGGGLGETRSYHILFDSSLVKFREMKRFVETAIWAASLNTNQFCAKMWFPRSTVEMSQSIQVSTVMLVLVLDWYLTLFLPPKFNIFLLLIRKDTFV